MSKSYYYENLNDRVQGFRRKRQDYIKVEFKKIEHFLWSRIS
jgi:hypothetical protein